jgi:hypothetical protein
VVSDAGISVNDDVGVLVRSVGVRYRREDELQGRTIEAGEFVVQADLVARIGQGSCDAQDAQLAAREVPAIVYVVGVEPVHGAIGGF